MASVYLNPVVSFRAVSTTKIALGSRRTAVLVLDVSPGTLAQSVPGIASDSFI